MISIFQFLILFISILGCFIDCGALAHTVDDVNAVDPVLAWMRYRGGQQRLSRKSPPNTPPNTAKTSPQDEASLGADSSATNSSHRAVMHAQSLAWAPIRITFNSTLIDSPSLDVEEVNGPQSCAAVGDRVQMGPSTSTMECAADQFSDCYIVCTAGDILTVAGRQQMVALVNTHVKSFFESFLSVQRGDGSNNALSIGYCGLVRASSGTYADTDTVVYLTARPTRSASALAKAYSCHVDATSQRPDGIMINIHPTTLAKGLSAQTLADTIRHEFIHGLGFSTSLMRYYRHPSDTSLTYYQYDSAAFPKGPVAGSIVTMDTDTQGFAVFGPNLNDGALLDDPSNRLGIVTPKALAWARDHFACPSLDMVELENQGGPGGAGSHWEERIYMHELMAPQAKLSNALSGLTLSLLEDMGWYTVSAEAYSTSATGGNNTISAPLSFGWHAGCAFALNKCSDTANNPLWPFDTTLQSFGTVNTLCTDDAKYVSIGGVMSYTRDLPASAQYFTGHPTYGGVVPQADYCPYVRENNATGNCRNSSQTFVASFLGNRAGPSSRCYRAEALQQGASSYNYAPRQGLCYETVCTSFSSIVVRIGDEYYPCPDGGDIQIDFQRGDKARRVGPSPPPTSSSSPSSSSFKYYTSSAWNASMACPRGIERNICGAQFATFYNSDVTFAFYDPPSSIGGTALGSSNSGVVIGSFPSLDASVTAATNAQYAVGDHVVWSGKGLDSCTGVLLGGVRHTATYTPAGTAALGSGEGALAFTVVQPTGVNGGADANGMGLVDVSLACALGGVTPVGSPCPAADGCVVATGWTVVLTSPNTTTTTTTTAVTTSDVSSSSSTAESSGASTVTSTAVSSGASSSSSSSATAPPQPTTTIQPWTPSPTTTPAAGAPTAAPIAATQCSGVSLDAVPRVYPQSPRFMIRLAPAAEGSSGGGTTVDGDVASNATADEEAAIKLAAFLHDSIEVIPPSTVDWVDQTVDMTAIDLTLKRSSSSSDAAGGDAGDGTAANLTDAHPFLYTLKMKAAVWKRNDLTLLIDILPTGFTDNERYLAFQFIPGRKSTSVITTDGPMTYEGVGMIAVPSGASDYYGGPNYGNGISAVANTAAVITLPALPEVVTYRPPFEAFIVQAATTEIPALTNTTTRFRAGSSTSASKPVACPGFKTELPDTSAIVFLRVILLPDDDFTELIDTSDDISLIGSIISLVSTFLSSTPAMSMMAARVSAVPTLSICEFGTDIKLPFPLMPFDYSVGEGKMKYHRGNVRAILILYAVWIVIAMVLGVLALPFMTMSPRLSCLQRMWRGYGGARMPSLWSVPVFLFALGCLLSTTAMTGNLALGEGRSLSISNSFIDIMSESSSSSVLGRNPPNSSMFKRAKDLATELNAANDTGDEFIADIVCCAVSYGLHLLFLMYLVVRLTSGFSAAALPEEGAGFAPQDAEKKTRGLFYPALKWVNDPEDISEAWDNYVMHYTFYFHAYTEPWQAFMLFEYSISILLGILLGVRIEQHCLIISVVFAGLQVILLLGMVVTRPHMTLVAWGLNTGMLGLGTIAAILAVAGVAYRQPVNEGAVTDNAHKATQYAIILSMISYVFVVIKVVYDFILFVRWCYRGKWRLGIENDGEQYVDGKAVILGGQDNDDRPDSGPLLARSSISGQTVPSMAAPAANPIFNFGGQQQHNTADDDFSDVFALDGGAANSSAQPTTDDADDIELLEHNSDDDPFSVKDEPPPPLLEEEGDSLEASLNATPTKPKPKRAGPTQKSKQAFRKLELTDNGVDRNALLSDLIGGGGGAAAAAAGSGISDDDI